MNRFRRIGLSTVAMIVCVSSGVVAVAASPRTDAASDPVTASAVTVAPDLSFEIVDRTPRFVRFIINDSSGRNFSGDPDFPLNGTYPPVAVRRYVAEVVRPTGTRQSQPLPLVVRGAYRHGLDDVDGCEPDRPVQTMELCVGFYSADNAPQPLDLPNLPGDISSALDVVLSRPDRFGKVDTEHIGYFGSSLAGLAGFMLLHPRLVDDRISALDLRQAIAATWMPAFRDPTTWAAAPPIHLTVGSADMVITYELVRRTVEAIGNSPTFSLVTNVGMGHDGGYCRPSDVYANRWLMWQLGVSKRPGPKMRERVTRSKCGEFGLVPGGSEGTGQVGQFMPRM